MTVLDKENVVILTVNPGSTSTKVALFHGETELSAYEVTKHHRPGLKADALVEEIEGYVQEITLFLSELNTVKLDAVVGRGGFVNRSNGPVRGGTYEVACLCDGEVVLCQDIITGVMENPELDHASNLGIPIAAELAKHYRVPAFCVDPVVADDFSPEARFSGYRSVERRSTAHALSVKMLGKMTADVLATPLAETRMVVAHMGGGITVAALKGGLMVDNNIALLGGGPFSPQRVGTLPMSALIDLCFDSGMTKDELQVELTRRGGLISYLNEDNLVCIFERIDDGDTEALAVLEAMAYQIAKEIGAMAVAAGHPLDAVVFSGGLSRSPRFVEMVRRRVEHLAPFHLFPGSVEMTAMARGARDVLTGKESAIRYKLERLY